MRIINTMKDTVLKWLQGTYIPDDNPTNSDSIFTGGGYYKRHWTARVVCAIGRIIAADWKWFIGTAIAVTALYINFFLKC